MILPTRPANDEDVLRDLDQRAQGYGNSKRLAQALGIDPSYLRSIRAGTEWINASGRYSTNRCRDS